MPHFLYTLTCGHLREKTVVQARLSIRSRTVKLLLDTHLTRTKRSKLKCGLAKDLKISIKTTNRSQSSQQINSQLCHGPSDPAPAPAFASEAALSPWPPGCCDISFGSRVFPAALKLKLWEKMIKFINIVIHKNKSLKKKQNTHTHSHTVYKQCFISTITKIN